METRRRLAGILCDDCGLNEVEEDGGRCAGCRLERRNVRRGNAGEWVYVYETSSQEEDNYYDK
jgi:hypothetical protein